MDSHRPTLVLVTTVPQTFTLILKDQPKILNTYFDVIVVASGKELEVYAQKLGVKCEIVPMRRRVSPLTDIYSIYRMVGVLRRHKPDIVHSFTPKAGLVASIAGRICGINARIHTFTGLIFPSKRGWWKQVLKWVDKLICSNVTHVIAEGRGVKQQLKEHKVCVEPLMLGNGNIAGVDEKFFSVKAFNSKTVALQHLRIDPALIAGKTVFLFVGRINKDKGIQDLFKAADLLDSEDYICLVVGDFDSSPTYEAFLKKTYLERNKNIQLLGFLNDVRTALLISDCLVLPSYREGFPNVLLQAGAMSKPCIASDIAGCNEIVHNGYNGFVIPPGSPDELAKAMHQFMCLSLEERNNFENNARENILNKFRRTDYEGVLIDFYRSLAR